ncbi:MAG TPA: DUF5131 family protein, partial [Polyangiaceae bacterium]|nr:DUF5131 family protein [Polyangiaceae bacterium]
VSVEPLLGPMDLSRYLVGDRRVGWVIVGGESGPSARATNPSWVRQLRDQCVEAQVPFFFKQWGEIDPNGRRVGKRAAGSLIDGQPWKQCPDPVREPRWVVQ